VGFRRSRTRTRGRDAVTRISVSGARTTSVGARPPLVTRITTSSGFRVRAARLGGLEDAEPAGEGGEGGGLDAVEGEDDDGDGGGGGEEPREGRGVGGGDDERVEGEGEERHLARHRLGVVLGPVPQEVGERGEDALDQPVGAQAHGLTTLAVVGFRVGVDEEAADVLPRRLHPLPRRLHEEDGKRAEDHHGDVERPDLPCEGLENAVHAARDWAKPPMIENGSIATKPTARNYFGLSVERRTCFRMFQLELM
jgi:hypothetical protein